jgi:hypothetical protein
MGWDGMGWEGAGRSGWQQLASAGMVAREDNTV